MLISKEEAFRKYSKKEKTQEQILADREEAFKEINEAIAFSIEKGHEYAVVEVTKLLSSTYDCEYYVATLKELGYSPEIKMYPQPYDDESFYYFIRVWLNGHNV